MFWSLFVGYCVVCQIVVAGFLLLAWFNGCESESAERLKELPEGKRVFAIGVVVVLAFCAAPIVAPLCLYLFKVAWKACSAEAEYWTDLRQNHTEMSLEPLREENIDEQLSEHIDQQASAAEALGYDKLGDFWLKPEPYNSKARLYLHPDGHTFAEIGVTLDTYYCELISFLEDGSVVSSAACEPFDEASEMKSHGYVIQFVSDGGMLDLLEAHTPFLNATCEEFGKTTAKITLDDWKDFFRYHDRHFAEVQHAIGDGNLPETPAEFPGFAGSDETNSVQPELV
jgi:hypothetical protein